MVSFVSHIQINELKAAIGPLTGRNSLYCTNECFKRYLEARNWNLDKSKKMLEDTLKWRSSFKPEEIRWVIYIYIFILDFRWPVCHFFYIYVFPGLLLGSSCGWRWDGKDFPSKFSRPKWQERNYYETSISGMCLLNLNKYLYTVAIYYCFIDLGD